MQRVDKCDTQCYPVAVASWSAGSLYFARRWSAGALRRLEIEKGPHPAEDLATHTMVRGFPATPSSSCSGRTRSMWISRETCIPPSGLPGVSSCRKSRPRPSRRCAYSHGSYWLDLGGTCIDVALFESHATRSRELEATNREMALFHCEAASRCIGMTFSARISMKNGPSPTGTSTVSSTSK